MVKLVFQNPINRIHRKPDISSTLRSILENQTNHLLLRIKRSDFMSESRPKGYYGKMKELLEIVAIITTIIWGVLTIVTSIYVPNSVTFEIAKYLFLVMIPITVSMIVLRFGLRDIRKEFETLPNSEQKTSQLETRMDKIERDIRIVKSYFTFKCPNCSNPMFLPILPSMVIRSKTHEKDGHPDKFQGDPEYEIGCPSCQKTWHIVFRK